MNELAHLEIMFNAVDTLPRALCRFDRYGDWCTVGRDGHIFADGKSYLIVVMTGESVRRWKNVKKRLAFYRISQGGDDEGCLHLDRLPTGP